MADSDSTSLRRELRRSGLSDEAVTAAWPEWWSDDAATSPSARAELRFTLARRLGLSAPSLLGQRVEFVWRDKARFKHLADLDEAPFHALTSFGAAIGQSLLRAAPSAVPVPQVTAATLRGMLTREGGVVNLQGLLSVCWAVGIPVIHLRVFPLENKSMHAMVVRGGSRFAILLGKDASYPSPVAFTLAHELAHVLLGHLGLGTVLMDVVDPAEGARGDLEEEEADRFALELLTGSPNPDIRINFERFNSAELADVVVKAGPPRGIDPGTLALCVAYRTTAWPVAMAALRLIYGPGKPVWREVNQLAASQLTWTELDDGAADYLARVIGMANA